MKILITGANGFLASNLVRLLNSRGFSVRAMFREGSNLKSLEGVVYEEFTGNLLNLTDMLEAMRDCQVVAHLAANTTQNASYFDYALTNIRGTANVIEAAIKSNIDKFIFVSTANAFGNGTKEKPGNEEKPFMAWLKKSGYALSKLKAQNLVLNKVKNGELSAVVVNPTFMIGANDAKPSSGKIILMSYKKKIRFCPPGGKNFVHVNDVANGIIKAIEKGRVGHSYILAGENLSYKEFFKKVDHLSGHKAIDITVPKWLLITAGTISDVFQKLFLFRSQFNLVNAKMLCQGNYYSPQKAITELDMPQTSIEQAAKEAINWFEENGYLKK